MFSSLKRRIVALCVVAVVAIWIGALALSYADAQEETRDLLDAHLAQAASLLATQSGDEDDAVDTDHVPDLHRYARSVSFQVWRQGRTLGLHSANAPDEPLGSEREGFSERLIGGVSWRVFSTWDAAHENLVHVGERIEIRDHLLKEIIEHMLKPAVLALPLLGLLLWGAVWVGLRPLNRIAAELEQRHPHQLEPVNIDGAPLEIRPLVARLNRLFARIDASFDNTRRFTADAAHELRTPLAAIRAQAQVAVHSVADADRVRAVQQVLRGCDLATHLVEQLLTLARLDSTAVPMRDPIELRALATGVIADLAETAITRDIEVVLAEGPRVVISGQAGLLRILLRNLLDNAIRYSGNGTEVEVQVGEHAGEVRLAVLDAGPGIPPEAMTRVFDRFYRVVGHAEEGSGLGLSIAQRIAQIHGGRIVLEARAEQSGLRVSFVAPASDGLSGQAAKEID